MWTFRLNFGWKNHFLMNTKLAKNEEALRCLLLHTHHTLIGACTRHSHQEFSVVFFLFCSLSLSVYLITECRKKCSLINNCLLFFIVFSSLIFYRWDGRVPGERGQRLAIVITRNVDTVVQFAVIVSINRFRIGQPTTTIGQAVRIDRRF